MPDGSRVSGLIIDDRESGIFRVHRSAFVSDEIFALERSLIFDRSWLFAGHVIGIPQARRLRHAQGGGTPSHSGAWRRRAGPCPVEHLPSSRQPGMPRAERPRQHVPLLLSWLGVRQQRRTEGPFRARKLTATRSTATRSGLEPVPRMHNHRGCIFVSFDPEMEAFESYMADALPVLDNTLDLGDMEFAHGQFKYSMRANWKLLVENSMDGYHLAFTHERWVDQWLPSEGIGRGLASAAPPPPAPGPNERSGAMPLGNGHTTTSHPIAGRQPPIHGLFAKARRRGTQTVPCGIASNVWVPKRAAWSRAAPGTT